nr:MAG TPA: hypothetical protein [Caudoviricetes sp.]
MTQYRKSGKPILLKIWWESNPHIATLSLAMLTVNNISSANCIFSTYCTYAKNTVVKL